MSINEATKAAIIHQASEMNRQAHPWYTDHAEIARLLRHLIDADETNFTATRCTELVAKPWNWTREYVEMLMQADGTGRLLRGMSP